MPKQYCPSCGAGTDYSLTAPKFCSSCGGGFGVAAIASKKPRRTREVIVDDNEDYDDDDEENGSGNHKFPSKLKFTVDPIPQFRKESLESLASQGPTGLGNYREARPLDPSLKRQKAQEILNNMREVKRHGAGE